MSYNGSGTFQINTSGQPVVTGTVISSTAFNSLTSDLATGLSTAITKDGQTTVTANIPLAGFKITGLGAATVGTDAVRYSQIQSGTDKLITVTGTDTLTGTMTPALTAYAAGNQFSFVAANTNTGAVTINIDGVGVKSITKNGTTALVAGNIVANSVVLIEYDGTRFQLLNVVVTATGDVVGPASSTANAIPTFSGTTGKLLQDNTKVKIVSDNITMDGSTSGTLTIAASAVSGTNTLTFPANTGTAILDYSTPAFRNRIINGAMVIAQRGTSTSLAAGSSSGYTADRFQGFNIGTGACSLIQASNAPSSAYGFINSLQMDVTTADTSIGATDLYMIRQNIEGLNITDLAWGTANAKTITLSFWVSSSKTGTYFVAFKNSAQDRCYAASYTVSVADTWQQVSITVAGDTSGTWLTTNGTGIQVAWGLAIGSNYQTATANVWAAGDGYATSAQVNVMDSTANNFYITGVQLEKGSTATSFDYRPYGTELALCQRYYYAPLNTSGTTSSVYALGFSGNVTSGSAYYGTVALPVTMRIAPTATWIEGNSSSFPATAADVSVVPSRNSLWAIKSANATGVGYYFGNFTCSAEL